MATEWGWKLTDGVLTPVATDRCAAPDRVLRLSAVAAKWHAGVDANAAMQPSFVLQ